MNERIKELYKQALVEVENDGFSDFELDANKFAKLIVQECADIAKHNVMNISTYADAEFVEGQIKNYFGI